MTNKPRRPLPYRSGTARPPATIELLLFKEALRLIRQALEDYMPREKARWN